MKDEGYIKFNCTWLMQELPADINIKTINACREKLYDRGLIGAHADGTGYGNVSIRLDGNIFLITGTTTGNIEHLTDKHYTTVSSYSIKQNTLVCEGPIKASSESLTHAIIYESMPSINVVIHIHNKDMWKNLIGVVPTTSAEVHYGTPEMALEMNRLIASTNLLNERILVMAGHEDGLIVIGKDRKEALNSVQDYYSEV